MSSCPEHLSDAPSVQRVTVEVEAYHLPQFSGGEGEFFAYVVRLENCDDQTWQLMTRHWRVQDGLGRVTQVDGEGVVGQQPLLPPGGVFVYDSFVTVPAGPQLGRMWGHFRFRNAWDEPLDVPVPEFGLAAPQGRLLN